MVTDEHGAHAPDPGWRPGDRGPRTRAGTAAQRMTDGRTTGGHPDVEALDAYLDARPDPSDQGFPLEPATARVERHVHSCATCQEALTALRRVRADLARLASMTMPADVAERIQAALAARSATDIRARESARSGRGPRAGTVGGPPRPRRRLGRVGSLPAAGLVAPGEFERKSTPGNAGRGTAGTGPDAADRDSGIAEQGTAGPDITAHGTTRGSTEPGRPPISGAPRPPRHGGGRRRGGLAGAGGRVARDWVSIAATCVALVAFGAAVLTLRGLTAGGGDASSTAANDAPTALSGASQTAGPEAARVPGPAAAAAVPSASGTPEEPSAAFTMVADSGEAVRAGDIVVHGRSLLTGRIPTTMLTWSVLPALSGATSVPPAAGEEQATDDGASTTVPGTDPSAASATTPETLARVIDTPQLRMCYDSLTAQTGGSVLALDRVRFDGQRALLVVLSVAGQPAAARVVVIDARCGVVPMPGAVLYTVNTTRAL
ncbi:hypothetical protein BBK14_05200 [Parafrankia soli]|uniref:Zinc-finger domain-containing protein n=1 Tax=Parafrankia soli TaxID=2599596 RepID=A0A1S1Q524_9ACTN|nr:hypothetical protein [Parafrankia soli]OHV27264.1 hypothetical protein BBK14_05200 [Parafrankia soli]